MKNYSDKSSGSSFPEFIRLHCKHNCSPEKSNYWTSDKIYYSQQLPEEALSTYSKKNSLLHLHTLSH